jgi:hypothetical protein
VLVRHIHTLIFHRSGAIPERFTEYVVQTQSREHLTITNFEPRNNQIHSDTFVVTHNYRRRVPAITANVIPQQSE